MLPDVEAVRPSLYAWLSAGLVTGSAILIFAVHIRPWAYIPLALGVALGLLRERELGKDLVLVAVGMALVSTISLQADLSDTGMMKFAVALSAAVIVPWAGSRYWRGHDAVRFPWRTGVQWNRRQWGYLVGVVVTGYLVLPAYFLTSEVWRNWPEVDTDGSVLRLLVGVLAVGTWDELFFICTVYALLRRHFPVWGANVLQSMVFVSFLWELGYQAWGPWLTLPFALIQGWTFGVTKSLPFVLSVHLLFDAVVFAVLVHAHRSTWFDIFVTG